MADRRGDRFDPKGAAETMVAVVTTGNGGLEKLEVREVPRPRAGPGDLLLKVLAAGVNNTEINTRLGWYSASVTDSTAEAAAVEEEQATAKADGGWNAATPFPFIQGTDCCGRVAAVGPGAPEDMMGARVLVRACMRPAGFQSMENVWLGSDFDGAFAQYVAVPASEVFTVKSDWSDAELATIPCAYGTAENMLERAQLGAGEHVLVTGASGGVGSATVQLAKRRGARVTAVAGRAKMAAVRDIGADHVLERGTDPLAALGEEAVDLVVDNVAGPGFPALLQVLRRGGRYVSSGAIAGPLVGLDMRSLYLKDLQLIGCTAWDAAVFPNLIDYIERRELHPLLARTFPLEEIAAAQSAFLEKKHVGNFVLIPPP